MRDFDEHNITDAVIDSLAQTGDARLKTITTSLVRHLHDFVRDAEITFDEWNAAIDFLTRTGQMCNDRRQEFILLSDTLGVSMLVDAINHRMPAGATETTVLGPFFVAAAPEVQSGADIAGGMEGEPLSVSGVVCSPEGDPLADATVDVWHADDDGYYDVQQADLQSLTMRARFRTDRNGRFAFTSVMPAFYPIPHDGPVGEMLQALGRHPYRPAHVHFMIAAKGYEMLITHIFDAESPYLDSDAVFGVKNSLIAEFSRDDRSGQPQRSLSYRFGLKPL
ncbi:intradiol ring-cleavage dioxygenase [Bradyrhizobium sp. CCBAU 51753]|uniref:intradiol ring-cleavage dioxygenase n=1 Tax=Bradyrhizobium sp. CCBAU 51753 TaxID=1325100 RepID=UPI00188CCC0C|nr:intradiol ring-cleavage dioxygenase [Bradyrhizobium sp. CCBAU 51753]QOZ24614.1 hydroxyquinol 1,2-dioxygenase [Bradyrhizobium sp. CCBAU 51753]